MMVYRCDRCGKIIERPDEIDPIRHVVNYGEAAYDDYYDGGTVEVMDLCDSCWDSFQLWKCRYVTKE